ncbi:MAG: hypothetical protein KC656_19105, partial [Myxococcales bacterium]|nr:hypothetical protein [Myxococcales bacterium]
IPGGSDALKEAAALVKDDDWARAIERWGEAYEASGGKVKGEAALNLAVASERSGDLSLARQWVGLAKAAWEGGPVVKYASELERRWNVNEKVATRTSRALEEGVTESAADLPLALPARRETSE